MRCKTVLKLSYHSRPTDSSLCSCVSLPHHIMTRMMDRLDDIIPPIFADLVLRCGSCDGKVRQQPEAVKQRLDLQSHKGFSSLSSLPGADHTPMLIFVSKSNFLIAVLQHHLSKHFPASKIYSAHESNMFLRPTIMLAPKGIYGNEIKILEQLLSVEKYRATASKKVNTHIRQTISEQVSNPKQRMTATAQDTHHVKEDLLLALTTSSILLRLPAMKHGRLENLEHIFSNLPEHIFRGLSIDYEKWIDEATDSENSASEMAKVYERQIWELEAARRSLRTETSDMAQRIKQTRNLLKDTKEKLKKDTETCDALECQSKIFHEALQRLEKLFALAKGLDEGWADYDKVMAQSAKLEEAMTRMENEPATSEEMDNFRADWEKNLTEKKEVMMKVMKVKNAWEEKTQAIKEAGVTEWIESRGGQVNGKEHEELDEIKMWEVWYGPPDT
jgi:hypothetical protein